MDEEKIRRIKQQLDETHQWPAVYMFKFIVPSDNERIALVESLFNSNIAQIRRTESSKGAYTSITAREVMTSAQAVLDIYEKASHIEGLIAL